MGRSKIHPGSVQFEYKSIVKWTGVDGPVKHSDPFRVSNSRVQNDLAIELAAIGVAQAMFQVDVDERHIRLDGRLRADARPRTGRVILTFEHPKQGTISMPCWQFRDLWANLRAISKTLEHLRGVDRYGVTQSGEQYTGWKQLPSNSIVVGSFATADAAARFIAEVAKNDSIEETGNDMLSDAELLKDMYRIAAKNAHPDMPCGSNAKMSKLNTARDMIADFQGREKAI